MAKYILPWMPMYAVPIFCHKRYRFGLLSCRSTNREFTMRVDLGSSCAKFIDSKKRSYCILGDTFFV